MAEIIFSVFFRENSVKQDHVTEISESAIKNWHKSGYLSINSNFVFGLLDSSQ